MKTGKVNISKHQQRLDNGKLTITTDANIDNNGKLSSADLKITLDLGNGAPASFTILDVNSNLLGALKQCFHDVEKKFNNFEETIRKDIVKNLSQNNQFVPGANLQGVDLEEEAMPGVDLSGANLRDANLQFADFTNAKFKGADLQNAILSYSSFEETDFSNADLRNANLTDVVFINAKFIGADLTGADFSWADLRGADFTGATLTGVNFSNTIK